MNHAEKVAQQRQLFAQTLAELHVTRPEYALILALNFGCTCLPSELPWRAVMEHTLIGDHDPLVTEENCQSALNDSLTKGWLQVIDDRERSRINAELRSSNVIGPIYGDLRESGVIDFTPAGEELWRTIIKRSSRSSDPTFAYADTVYQKTFRYFHTREAAHRGMAEACESESAVTVSGPIEIGPWRAQWWRRFSQGYRIEVETRQKWQGKGDDGDEDLYVTRNFVQADFDRLREILDGEGINLAQWLHLMALANSGTQSHDFFCEHTASAAQHDFGISLPEEEYQVALEALLNGGWLRKLDQLIINEIRKTLHTDPTILAVPRTARLAPNITRYDIDPGGNLTPVSAADDSLCGDIDFTPFGAEKYQQISSKWLGPNWEDSLVVRKDVAWETHYYSESTEGFGKILQEHLARGRTILAKRITAIGPWCLHWWKIVPNGYRLELEISDL